MLLGELVNKSEDPDLIVSDAEAAAVEAQALVTAIEDRIMAGDASVSHDDLSKQISISRFAAKFVEGARAKAAGIRAANAAKARDALRAEILRDAPANGDALLKLVDRVVEDSNRLVLAIEAHDAQQRGWVQRALDLGVPDRGVISADHAGMGVSAGGDLLIGTAVVRNVSASNIFRLLFIPIENGIIPTPDLGSVASARSIVANIGKAAV